MCPIIFESAMYPMQDLNLTMRYDKKPVSLKTFTQNGQWDLLDAKAVAKLNFVTRTTAFGRVEILLTLGRKTLYYQLNVLFPCGLYVFLLLLLLLFLISSSSFLIISKTTDFQPCKCWRFFYQSEVKTEFPNRQPFCSLSSSFKQ